MSSILRLCAALLAVMALSIVVNFSVTTEVYGYRADSSSGKVFIFDPRRLKWYAYRNGRLVKSGRASGGRGYCPDVGRSCRTPVGRFKVFSKGGRHCQSSKYPRRRSGRHGGAPMPYCMFFRGGYGIHGSPDVPNRNASHGCIRVKPGAASWLHGNFISIGTRVIVKPY